MRNKVQFSSLTNITVHWNIVKLLMKAKFTVHNTQYRSTQLHRPQVHSTQVHKYTSTQHIVEENTIAAFAARSPSGRSPLALPPLKIKIIIIGVATIIIIIIEGWCTFWLKWWSDHALGCPWECVTRTEGTSQITLLRLLSCAINWQGTHLKAVTIHFCLQCSVEL